MKPNDFVTASEANGVILGEFSQSDTQQVRIIAEYDTPGGVLDRIRFRRMWRKDGDDAWKLSKSVYLSAEQMAVLLPWLESVVLVKNTSKEA